MLSGIGPAAHLRDHGIAVVADRAGVGANLQDHIDYVSSWETRTTAPFGDSLGGTWRMVTTIVEHRLRRTGIMPTCFADAGGLWSSRHDLPAPATQYHVVSAQLEELGRTRLQSTRVEVSVCGGA